MRLFHWEVCQDRIQSDKSPAQTLPPFPSDDFEADDSVEDGDDEETIAIKKE